MGDGKFANIEEFLATRALDCGAKSAIPLVSLAIVTPTKVSCSLYGLDESSETIEHLEFSDGAFRTCSNGIML